MKGKRLLAAFLLGVGLCFVPATSMAREPTWDGYWWNDRENSEKLSYVAGFVEGFNYLSGLLSLYVELDFEELGGMGKKQLAELDALWAQRAHEFGQMKRCVEEIDNEGLKHDLDEYYRAEANRELAIADAIRILHIVPSIIPDWMLDYRINELKALSGERYEYLKKRYLEEKQRRERN